MRFGDATRTSRQVRAEVLLIPMIPLVRDRGRGPRELHSLIDAGSHVESQGLLVEAEPSVHVHEGTTEELECIPANSSERFFVMITRGSRPVLGFEPVSKTTEGDCHVEQLLRWSTHAFFDPLGEQAKIIAGFVRTSHEFRELSRQLRSENCVQHLFGSVRVSSVRIGRYPLVHCPSPFPSPHKR